MVHFWCNLTHVLDIRYLEGTVVPDISDNSQDTTEVPTGRRRDYIPSSQPGSRLPHMNVRVLKASPSEVCPPPFDSLDSSSISDSFAY